MSSTFCQHSTLTYSVAGYAIREIVINRYLLFGASVLAIKFKKTETAELPDKKVVYNGFF